MYKKILVTLDGSELAECVLPHVEIFIRECKVDNLVFLRVVQPSPFPYSAAEPSPMIKEIETIKAMDEARRVKAAEYLKGVTKKFENGSTRLYTETMIGSIPDEIVGYAEQNGVDLIIMATHGRSGVSRWVRGSVAERVLRASSIPILLVRAPGTKEAI